MYVNILYICSDHFQPECYEKDLKVSSCFFLIIIFIFCYVLSARICEYPSYFTAYYYYALIFHDQAIYQEFGLSLKNWTFLDVTNFSVLSFVGLIAWWSMQIQSQTR